MLGDIGSTRPLEGFSVVVTRAVEQAGGLSARLRDAGARVIEFPTIMTVPPDDYGPVDSAIDGLDGFDFVIFTSVNALRYFAERAAEKGVAMSRLSGLGIVVVGPKTAEMLHEYGLKPTVMPREFVAEGVMAELEKMELRGKRFLFPRAEVAREVIPDRLTELGAEVVVTTVYRTVMPEVDPEETRRIFESGIDAITFTSSSTVGNFARMVGDKYKEYLQEVAVACIGPATRKTCEGLGIDVSVMPDEYTVDALFDALVQHVKRRKTT